MTTVNGQHNDSATSTPEQALRLCRQIVGHNEDEGIRVLIEVEGVEGTVRAVKAARIKGMGAPSRLHLLGSISDARAKRANGHANGSAVPPPRSEDDYGAESIISGHRAFDFDEMRLATQRRDLNLLRRIRGSTFKLELWAAFCGVDLKRDYEWGELGIVVGFTVKEDERFGSDTMGRKPPKVRKYRSRMVQPTAAQFSPHLSPAGETSEQCDKRRRKFRYQQRKQAMLVTAMPPPNMSLEDRRVYSVLEILPDKEAKAIPISAAATKVKRRDGFDGLKPTTVRQYVWEIVRRRTDSIGTRSAKNGDTTLLIWRFSRF
jgi:hypothetical protein